MGEELGFGLPKKLNNLVMDRLDLRAWSRKEGYLVCRIVGMGSCLIFVGNCFVSHSRGTLELRGLGICVWVVLVKNRDGSPTYDVHSSEELSSLLVLCWISIGR